jgi:hypothetical protein
MERVERVEQLLSQLRTTWRLADAYSQQAYQEKTPVGRGKMWDRARTLRQQAEVIQDRIIAEVAS